LLVQQRQRRSGGQDLDARHPYDPRNGPFFDVRSLPGAGELAVFSAASDLAHRHARRVIGMDGRSANRRQIFDIGLAGPLADLV
jgi:hypothetical protein